MPETTVKLPATGTWTLHPSMTTVEFIARKLVVSKVRGAFEKFEGTLVVADPIEQSSLDVTIEMASIQTHDEKRDGHLRSADFFDVETYPSMTFKSTAIEHLDDVRWNVTGDLTIKGVSRPVTLAVTFEGLQDTPWGFEQAVFTARGDINREEWGLNWNHVLEAGNVLVGNTIAIEIEAALKPA